MSQLSIENNAPVVRLATTNRVWRVSPVLEGWLRLHAAPEVRGEMLDFLVGDEPVDWRRTLMFARRLGVTDAPLIERMTIESWGLETVHAAADFADGTCWASSRLILATAMPETVLAAMDGRLLGDVVDNPYLPADARIARACADTANRGRAAIHLEV